MPWNLLVLPLVGGYYILTRSHYFRFRQQRLDKQRLIFESILLAVCVLVFTYFIRVVFEYFAADSFCDSMYKYFPIKTPYIGTTSIALVFSIVLTKGSNYFLEPDDYIKRAIKTVGNEFELLLKSSFVDDILLQITLSNDKVYVGWVKELPIPTISNYIRIVPTISGYRNTEKEIEYTTHYLTIYSEYVKEGRTTNIWDLKSDLVIDISEIISVSFFDYEMSDRFNQQKG